MRTFCFFIAFSSLALGQVQPTDSAAAPAGQKISSFVRSMNDARDAIKSGNVTAAEQALSALNLSSSDSGEWHLETAHRLVQLSATLAQEGHNEANVDALVRSGIKHLEIAARTARNAGDQAQAKAAEADIYLRFIGDIKSAIAAYKQAALLAPHDAGINQALNQLLATDARISARNHLSPTQ